MIDPSIFLRVRRSATRMAWIAGFCAGAWVVPEAGAAPQGPWILPASNLSQPGASAFEPRIAVGGDGTASALWYRSEGSDAIAQASVRPPGGDFGMVEDLSAPGQDVREPQVAVGEDGTTTVVWHRSDGVRDIVQSRTRPPGGSFGPTEDLSPDTQDSQDPQVAIGPDGTTAVAWRRENVTDDQIQIRIRPPGGVFGIVENLSASGQSIKDHQVAFGPDDILVAVWNRLVSGSFIVQTRTRVSDGTLGFIQNLSDGGVDTIDPGIAVAPDGAVSTIWRLDKAANDIIQSRSRSPTGSFGSTDDLSASTDNSDSPRISVGSDGTTAAVWFRASGLNDVAQARIRPPAGNFGPVENLTGPVEVAGDLGVAVAPDGTVSPIWYGKIGPDILIQSATRPPDGDFAAPQFLSAGGQNSSYPDIAIGPDGVATAIWSRYNGTDDIVQSASTRAPKYSFTVENLNPNRGTVTSTPAGITCGDDCGEDYTSHTEVTLTAIPIAGNDFSGWSGDCLGVAGPTCELEMTEARSATAGFAAGPPPPVVCPPKTLKPKKMIRNKRKGTAKLKVKAGGKGKVILRGSKKVKKSVRKVGKKGKGKLTVKPKRKFARKLKKRGRLKFRVKLVYRPGGNCPNKRTKKKVRLVRR